MIKSSLCSSELCSSEFMLMPRNSMDVAGPAVLFWAI